MQQEQRVIPSVKSLLEVGSHFGHQKRRWNPKMKRYIFDLRKGLYIIDLAKTLSQIKESVAVLKEFVAQKKSILFVGTKKQAKSIVKECAELCGEYYVSERWLGGALTNMSTIRQSVKTLEKIEKKTSAKGSGLTKKELSMLEKEQVKLNKNLSGIRSMRRLPELLIIVDPSHEHIAVAEAKKLGIPIMALVDTNCDPDPIDYVIPCNDDAVKSIELVLKTLTHAILEVKQEMRFSNKAENSAFEPTQEIIDSKENS